MKKGTCSRDCNQSPCSPRFYNSENSRVKSNLKYNIHKVAFHTISGTVVANNTPNSKFKNNNCIQLIKGEISAKTLYKRF